VRAGRIGKEALLTHKRPSAKASLPHLHCCATPSGQTGRRATGVWCASHVVLGQFPAPNPVEHFSESCKPRKNLPANQSSQPSEKRELYI